MADRTKGETKAEAQPEPRTEADIAEITGQNALKRRALEAARSDRVKITKNPVPGQPDIIEGETVAEMRARVRKEREEAEPTEFQRSFLPDRAAASTANVTATGGATGAAAAAAAPATTRSRA